MSVGRWFLVLSCWLECAVVTIDGLGLYVAVCCCGLGLYVVVCCCGLGLCVVVCCCGSDRLTEGQ